MSYSSFLPIIITLSGAFMIWRLKACFLIHPLRYFGCLGHALRGREAKAALSLALAGTLGVGNIIGVAVGLSIGGAGCVPWMLISSIFSSVLKFSEASLSSSVCSNDARGMIVVIRSTFAKLGGALSGLYALLCLALAFSMGSALQISSALECVEQSTDFSPLVFYLIIATFLLLVISKGLSSIERFTSVAIPIATIIYVCLALWCVGLNFDKIPVIVSDMIFKAFSFDSVFGGAAGVLFSKVISEGFSRGLLSNEAGAGTSSFAHSLNSKATPIEAGMLGVCEVIFDTVLLCFITALSVLCCIEYPESYNSGVELVLNSVGASFGGTARIPVILSIVVFSFSTVVCWYYYGAECYKYVCKSRCSVLYTFLFFASTFLGYAVNVESLVLISDYVLVLLSLISCSTVIKNSGKVKSLAGEIDFKR